MAEEGADARRQRTQVQMPAANGRSRLRAVVFKWLARSLYAWGSFRWARFGPRRILR